MPLMQHAQFHTSAHQLGDLPPPGAPEIAFAGRSNAGKSSAINTLANQTRLAFVSKTPGRTQLINFFSLGDAFLVDLPGYGYADVPEKVRHHWQEVLSTYLQYRPTLAGLVLIMDIRRPLTALDRQMLDWFGPTGKPVHVLLTKADKLPRSHAMKALKEAQAALAQAYPNCTVQLFSSLKKQGVEEAEQRIAEILYPPAAQGTEAAPAPPTEPGGNG